VGEEGAGDEIAEAREVLPLPPPPPPPLRHSLAVARHYDTSGPYGPRQ
jgi:hypothetical protein